MSAEKILANHKTHDGWPCTCHEIACKEIDAQQAEIKRLTEELTTEKSRNNCLSRNLTEKFRQVDAYRDRLEQLEQKARERP